jgi:hypothetical protein
VIVLQGRRNFEREELVDKYRLGVGDNRRLTKLKEFGIEPFRIAVTFQKVVTHKERSVYCVVGATREGLALLLL